MRRRLASAAVLAALAACSSYDRVVEPGTVLPAPTGLFYELIPSGDASAPEGILLTWDPIDDSQLGNYVVYSRGSTSDSWLRRAETTSSSFHDIGIPHLQYYVTAEDLSGVESGASNVVTVDERNQMDAPASLTSISLNHGVHLSWDANSRLAEPSLFSYYRVYSTEYSLDSGLCDDADWVLEGTTVSEDFLATGLPNGAARCFAASTVSVDGHESLWSDARTDTPRWDARNVVIYAAQSELGASGFRFYLPSSNLFGAVLSGDRSDIDFVVTRQSDGSLWLQPVRSGTRVALYDTQPVEDLTSIDIAPLNGFSTGAIEAVPGYGYVFETQLPDGLHYGAVRVTHVGADYLILDWSYQSDYGNPELRRWRSPGGGPL